MTDDVAFQAYMESACMEIYGVKRAYPVTSSTVIKDAILPYITYEWATSDIEGGDVPIVVQLWERTYSEATPNEHARSFRKYIEENDTVLYEDGSIWVKPGTPFCRSLKDEVDPYIKRRYINVTLEFLTR